MRRKVPLVTEEIYHIFNRGVNKNDIFFEDSDYSRFYNTALHYKNKETKFSYTSKPKNIISAPGAERVETVGLDGKVEVCAYCFMPNHFHFLLKQLVDGGICAFMSNLANSYVHYVNLKYGRVGSLFQGRFQNVHVSTNEQLVHLSRYIHLNPVVSGLTFDLDDYHHSSYLSYVGEEDALVSTGLVLSEFPNKELYKKFVIDHADYAMSLEAAKHLLIDG